MSILVTGGAGYIGSHVSKQLLEQNRDIIILDNLSTGRKDTLQALKKIKNFEFIEEDLKNFEKIENIFKKNSIDTIIHFAASIVVSESVENPIKYYMNNTINTTNLIKLANDYGVKKVIFSSTAAVYGEPVEMLSTGIDENFKTNPINPYGMSKLMSENIIKDVSKLNRNFKFIIFRYFNVAGADIHYKNQELNPRIGQISQHSTHLIKIASECASKKRKEMSIFGDDYSTFDGTCIRDYIHVDDLAFAHIQSIDYLDENESDTFNVGYGKGYSVKEIIETVKKVTQDDFNVTISKRRLGDPSVLISDNSKILSKLGWKSKYDNIELICESAFKWEKKLDE